MAIRFREELTDWGHRNITNHIYITDGRTLVGYVPAGQKKPVYFNQPKRLWSATGRKFRDLSKKEMKEYV